MSRNDVKEMILSVINDNSILESDKKEQVIELFHRAEYEIGCRNACRLAKQIQKESGFDMSASILLKKLSE